MSLNTISFTESEDGSDLRNPGGYLIRHIFQLQADEMTNTGQYDHTVQVETWEDIGPAIEHLLNHPEGSGFTLSITVTTVNSSDLNIATSPIDGEN